MLTIWAFAHAAAAAHAQSTPAPATAAVDSDPTAMIVLDGSGSMWGKLGKEQKINAVRDVLKAALPKAPAPLSLGLTAFGHRRTGDCSDVEIAVPPAKATTERLTGFLDKINPKGKGPLGKAIGAAAEQLAEKTPKEARRSLIVIADNADNCKIDTCDLADDLKRDHPGLVVHVIALAVSKEETKALSCLSSATSGRYFNVEQTSEIAGAVEQSLKLAGGPVMPVPPAGSSGASSAAAGVSAPTPPVVAATPTGAPGLRLTALLATGGAQIVSGIRWRVLADDGAAKAAARPALYEGEDPNPDIDLAAGTYRVEATFGLASAVQTVTVGAAGRTQARVSLDAGIISVKDGGARGGSSTDRIFYTLYAAAGGPKDKPRALSLSSDAAPVYNVAAGSYVIAVQQGLARIERSVAIAPGAVTEVDVPLYLGELALSAVATEGGAPLERVLFQVFEDDPDAAGGLRELVRSGAVQPEFSLPAGSYLIVARHEGAEARERISVKPGTRLNRALVLASGRVSLSAKAVGRTPAPLDPSLLSYRVERLGSGAAKAEAGKADAGKTAPAPVAAPVAEEIGRFHAPEQALALTAGRYRVEVRYGAINARRQREIDVKAGNTQEVMLDIDAGLITLRSVDRRTGGVVPRPQAPIVAETDVYWEILDGAGQVVWSTSQATPKLPLASGRYSARVETRTAKAEQAFQVSSGDDKTVEIELK